MWPLDFKLRRPRDVVRIGRQRVERWAMSAQGFVLREHRSIDPHDAPDAGELGSALRALLHARGAPIDVLLESAWLPLMLLPAGPAQWSPHKLQALLRHRLGQLYDGGSDPVQAWEFRLDHRPGDARALGYGLAPSVRQAVVDAAAATGQHVASLQPAFAWGWRHLKSQRRVEGGAEAAWWLWIEQDRCIVCRFVRGRIEALNAGAGVPQDAQQALRLIEVEASREGLPMEGARGLAAGWADVPSGGAARFSWISLAACANDDEAAVAHGAEATA